MRTAEAVSFGHPDKICDQISDAILDECLIRDEDARVAIETMGGHGKIYICGEISMNNMMNKSDISAIARKVYRSCGYEDEVKIQVNVVSQSPDISQGVDNGGAGDQGIMIGYACNDNEQMIPQELYLARKILKEVIDLGYGPDGKSQVTLNDQKEISRLVLSVQHKENETVDSIKEAIRQSGIIFNCSPLAKDIEIIVNGTGKFVIGGFQGDTGLTGRKIVQDAYGPQVSVGGGAFSGKDPSKVDRSAAYMARKIAVDLLKDLSIYDEALVKIAYSIGVAEPVMAVAEIGTLKAEIDLLKGCKYDLTPKGIIDFLDLKKPIYQKTAKNGHFGNGFNWDK